MTLTNDALLMIQDAYHHALAAAGEDNSVTSHPPNFRERQDHLQQSRANLAAAGLSVPAASQRRQGGADIRTKLGLRAAAGAIASALQDWGKRNGVDPGAGTFAERVEDISRRAASVVTVGGGDVYSHIEGGQQVVFPCGTQRRGHSWTLPGGYIVDNASADPDRVVLILR
jgi:hypothetical protein